MKKTGAFVAILLIFLLSASLSVLAAQSGELEGSDCNNSWKYIEETKTLYLLSARDGYNETGRPSDSEDGAWSEFVDEIEHVVLLGNFSKVSDRAFEKHSALKDVYLAENTEVLGAYCFYACESLESVSVVGEEHKKGFADLRGAHELCDGAFYQTKIERIAVAPDCTVGDYHLASSESVFYAKEGSYSHRSLSSKGYNTQNNEPFEIEIILRGEKLTRKFYPYENITFPSIGGECVALYRDAEYSIPYEKEYPDEDITLYARPIVSALGFDVRTARYQGLRALYLADCGAAADFSGYVIKEIGSLAGTKKGICEELHLETDGVFRSAVYTGGQYTGALLSFPEGEVAEFAQTAVGYGKGDDLAPMSEVEFLFRGYVILENTESGETLVRYTDAVTESLAGACSKVLAGEAAEALSKTKRAFISAPLDAGAAPEYIYTKKELISTLTMVGRDEKRYILGQTLSENGEGIFGTLEKYRIASGRYPAMLSLELSRAVDQLDACIDYAKQGGIISVYSVLPNPSGGRVDSPLGAGTEADFALLLMNGTDHNEQFNDILDEVAKQLEIFDEAGCPVIWDPLHGIGSGDVWYSPRSSVPDETVQRLTIYVYNYITEICGIDSVVWCYASSPEAYRYYPGDRYCDVVALDAAASDEISSASAGRIFAFSSCALSSEDALLGIKGEGKKNRLAYALCGGDISLPLLEQILRDEDLLASYEVGELFDMHFGRRE